MEAPAAIIQKIQDKDLQRQAISSAPQSQTVIVELALPQPTLERAEPSSEGRWGRPRLRFAAPQHSPADVERQISEARQAIERILGRPAEAVLPSSGTVVVVADGKQLRSIAGLPSVAAIWPNKQRGRLVAR